jgi:hypothetical protein
MHSASSVIVPLLFWKLHVLSVLAFGVGLIFVITWAIKKLTPLQLRNVGIALIVSGAALCLITFAISPFHLGGHQEIKDMAEAIMSAQQTEIDQMHQWQRDWGYAE